MEEKYKWYVILKDGKEERVHLKKCNNPECSRLVRGKAYCCDACRIADVHGGEVVHTDECDKEQEKFKDAVPIKPEIKPVGEVNPPNNDPSDANITKVTPGAAESVPADNKKEGA